MRLELYLPSPILCDTERRVIKDWDIYNPREKGGIAKPAVFIVDSNRMMRYSATRVPASEIVRVLQTTAEAQLVRRCFTSPFWTSGFARFAIAFGANKKHIPHCNVDHAYGNSDATSFRTLTAAPWSSPI